MKNNKVAFVFTNYNNYQHTINITKSIHLFSNLIPIIIVDNNSNEKNILELKTLEETYSNIKVIYNTINYGYFKGLNIGIEYVLNNIDFDILVIGNNDLLFTETFLEDIYKSNDIFEKYAVIAPNIITLDNECQNPHVLNEISYFRHLAYDLYYLNYSLSKFINFISFKFKNILKRKDYLHSNTPKVIYQGYGACYLLGPLFFKYYNQLFAPTFLMGEEFFLAYQLKLQNLDLFYEPTIKVYHQDHASTGLIESKKFWKISKESHKIYKKYLKSYG